MKRCCAIVLALFAATASGLDTGAAEMLTCARDVARATFYAPSATNQPLFRFTGRVSYIREAHDAHARIIAVEDATGAVTLNCPADCAALAPGDTAVFYGRVRRRTNALIRGCRIVSSGPCPKPIESNVTDLLDGLHDFRLASFTGTLRDVADSETAPRWLILVVCSRIERMFVSVPDRPGAKERLKGLIGHKVEVTGVCVPHDPSRRMRVGRTFKVSSGEDIRPTGTESNAPIPDIADIRFARPAEIQSLGRHSATGRVIAAWQGKHALISTGRKNGVVGLELAEGVEAPRHGDLILAVGLPESDLYRINLTNVGWTRLTAPESAPPVPHEVSARSICTNALGYRIVKSEYHGRAISLKGIIRSLPGGETQRMHVECDGLLVPVDASSLPKDCLNGIDIGCTVKVSGTCVVSQEKTHRAAAFPRMDGFMLVLRNAGDVKVIARPSWWTPRRLLFVIGGLLTVLLSIVVANRMQKRKAARMAKFATDMKVEERTRLAVELHDSLAQNLTGVSFEIDTADKLANKDAHAMHEHLDRAARMLKSCRDELRNCLWDLRNRALEETSLDEAILQTLAPHVAGVKIAIRFNVPRERMSDNTTHSILRIIRELAINAIRHGSATKIWIAGSLDGDRLLFSVRDNGSGFDPASAPGFENGHYGLVGIRERVESFEGDFEIESHDGDGATATVSIKLPHSSLQP